VCLYVYTYFGKDHVGPDVVMVGILVGAEHVALAYAVAEEAASASGRAG
jgi:hypothetical protein